jgi:hypothetical protein
VKAISLALRLSVSPTWVGEAAGSEEVTVAPGERSVAFISGLGAGCVVTTFESTFAPTSFFFFLLRAGWSSSASLSMLKHPQLQRSLPPLPRQHPPLLPLRIVLDDTNEISVVVPCIYRRDSLPKKNCPKPT